MNVYLNFQEEIRKKEEEVKEKENMLEILKKDVEKGNIELYTLKEKRKEMLEHIVHTHQIEFLTRLSDCAKIKETSICKKYVNIIMEPDGGQLGINTSFDYGWKVSIIGNLPESITDKINEALQDFTDKYLEDVNA